jgi:hypothetical protein
MQIALKYDMDIMCECKLKELCVKKLLDKHFEKVVDNGRIIWSFSKW